MKRYWRREHEWAGHKGQTGQKKSEGKEQRDQRKDEPPKNRNKSLMTPHPLRDQWPHSANGPFSGGRDQKGPVPSSVPLQGPRRKKTSTRRPIKSPALHLKAINIPVRPARFLWAWQVWARLWGLSCAAGDWLTVYLVRAWEIGGGRWGSSQWVNGLVSHTTDSQ